MLKAVLLDFDGTLVTKDILDVVCGIVNNEEESARINKDFHSGKLTGISPLITRINFLKGVTLKQITERLNQNSYLMPGAKELFSYLKQHSIVSVIYSGNILPILEYYQKLLDADFLVGTQPKMDDETIIGISEDDFPGRDFKVLGVKKTLEKLSIQPEETLAIGDSPADKTIFAFVGKSIAINPKESIEAYADFVIKDSLSDVIPIIEKYVPTKLFSH